MNRLSHIISNHIFIFATSLAMLVHSTWTFGTLFSGKQPIINGTLENWIAYFLWVTPALLVALAIDVGQIQTSVKLSHATARSQKVTLGITFITLAMAGYYLQWFHLAHHIPALEFGAGLTEDMRANLEGLKALAIFFVPALLPLSTVLYTLSSDAPNNKDETVTPTPQIDIRFPILEPAIWSDDTKHIHVLPDETETEPVEPVKSISSIIEDSKSVTRPVRTMGSDNEKRCEFDGCGKVIKNPRPNQKYCTVVCRNNAYKARQKVDS
jgi:hypothetical protein